MNREIPTTYKIDGKYLVAISPRWGQSTGEALIAEFKRHQPGHADRVPDDDVQNTIRANVVSTLNARPEIIAALEWSAKSIHHPACPIARGKNIETITHNPCTCHVKAAKVALAKLEG